MTGLIYLESEVDSVSWNINILPGATQDIDFVVLKDGDGTISQTTPIADNSAQFPTMGWIFNEWDVTSAMLKIEGVNISGIDIN